MMPIAQVVDRILASPAAVIAVDTCSLLDLFRLNTEDYQPRVPPDEIAAVAGFLQQLAVRSSVVHLVVPELIPREFTDHADQVEKEFQSWFKDHDANQHWLANSSRWIGFSAPTPLDVSPLGIPSRCRKLAEELLAQAMVLNRDRDCLDRAVVRLIAKTRPSHKKEMKDSMNLEQVLELSRKLQSEGFALARVFVSSNTKDFAEKSNTSKLHPDLQQEFAAAGLEYFTSFSQPSVASGPEGSCRNAVGLIPTSFFLRT
jgi:hypothetical protein